MAYKNVPNLEIENATILWPNFAGKETRYNRAGDRNFCVIIDNPREAQNLSDYGWNIKIRSPRDEGDEPQHYIQVTVNFNFWKRPEIYMITRNGKVLLDEESVTSLDYADISHADIVIRPRVWDDNGVQRIKAYLQELYVVVEESRFAAKYANYDYPREDDDENVPF